MDSRGGFFREIHKNTWLKRSTAEGKRVTIGAKKCDRTWVVFCIHDDTDALLEGYAEPKLAPSHKPEWTLSLQSTQHVSHTLIHNEKEFEFVITLENEVVRFHAMSWAVMQEWVDILRQKLREMKILSPRENLYTKPPENRFPLLPTRDPTSPLPATPPVPAAIVPGVECVTTTAATTITTSSLTTLTNTSSPATSNTLESSAYLILQNTPGSSQNTSTFDPMVNIQTTAVVHQETINDLLQHQVIQEREQISSDRNILNATSTVRIESIVDIESPVEITAKNDADVTSGVYINQINNSPILNTENSIRVDVVACTEPEVQNVNFSQSVLPSTDLSVLRTESQLPTTPLRKASAITAFKNNSNFDKIESFDDTNGTTISDNNSDSTNIMIIHVSNSELTKQSHKDTPHSSSSESSVSVDAATDCFKSNVQIIPSCLDDLSSSIGIAQVIKTPELIRKGTTTVKVSSNNTIDYQNVTIGNSSAENITKWPEKIILSTNTSGITNICVGNESPVKISTPPAHYDKVFFASSSSPSSNKPVINILQCQSESSPLPPSKTKSSKKENSASTSSIPAPTRIKNSVTNLSTSTSMPTPSSSSSCHNVLLVKKSNSPCAERKRTRQTKKQENIPPPPPFRRTLLTRGATEAVITARPSRFDFIRRPASGVNEAQNATSVNASSVGIGTVATEGGTRSESLDRRQRSSSASESDKRLQSTGGGEIVQNQQQHIQRLQPFRFVQDNKSINISKKVTLREQQVIQLRREIMHPGGVRLQLRKKDCLGSIAWVDIFGTVWVAGWKQKDHPMLYNAIHIGDQLVSIAGNPIKTATEANKIIRSSNNLFLEILIRRIPFGRVFAIKREIDGQCLGLIRDGNSATIVDVVPNSLAARHGLSPKAKTCDGLSLTFWVLTEINGRPLNLLSKENEVHDRLNSVGRDISILVQPLDLITKLRKQLKSIRSFKDYIIQ